MVFISVDVEASGTLPGYFDLLSIGAVIVRRGEPSYEISGPELYLELKPIHGTSDPASMRVNGLDLARLQRDGQPLAVAAAKFAAWVKACSTPRDPPVFVGYCANFDWAFVNDMFKRAGLANPFGYRAFDIRSFAYGLFPYDWQRISHTRLLRLLHVRPLAAGKAHHALHDARHQAEMLIALLERRSGLHRGT